MLGGQASLQELIGRSFMTRKRSGPKAKKKSPAADLTSTSQELSGLKSTTASTFEAPAQALQPGQVVCPVCGVPTVERAMNGHLGKCHAYHPLPFCTQQCTADSNVELQTPA